MLAHASYTPDSPDADNGGAIITGVHFTVDQSFVCTSIDFRVPTTNTGTYTGALHQATGTSAGTLLSSGTLASGSTSGGADASIPLAAPQTLSTGVVYVAAVHSSSGHYTAKGGGLAGAITGNHVTLLAAGSNPNPPGLGSLFNGLFNDAPGSTTAYPTQAFNTSDYGVDIGAAATIAGTASATLPAPVATVIGTTYGTAFVSLGVLSATVTGPAAQAQPDVGRGWNDLLSIIQSSREKARQDAARPLAYCPNDQVPLQQGAGGVLYCPFDGWRSA